MLTKLLPSFIQKPDLNSCDTTEAVELIFICCAAFSLDGVIKSPIIIVRNVKKIPTSTNVFAIFLIE